MNPILLCGFKGCGKTTLGTLLAQKLSLPFFDTDQIIEKHTGKSPREIFIEEGNAQLREIETEILHLLEPIPSVISLGGGSLHRKENRQFLSALGKLIYLKTSPEILWKRLQSQGLPPFISSHQDFKDLFSKYRLDYEDVSDYIFEADGETLEELSNKIITKLI